MWKTQTVVWLPTEASARRELTIEAAFSSLLNEARVAFGNRRAAGQRFTIYRRTSANNFNARERALMFFPTDAKDGQTSSSSAAKCTYISQRDYCSANIGITVMIVISSVTGVAALNVRGDLSQGTSSRIFSRKQIFVRLRVLVNPKATVYFVHVDVPPVSQAKLTKDEWKAEVVGKPSEIVHPDSIPSSKMNLLPPWETSPIEKKLIATAVTKRTFCKTWFRFEICESERRS